MVNPIEWPEDRAAVFRLGRIHQLTEAGRYPSCQYLAEWLEVSNRTVQRDIELLRNLGANILYDKLRKGYYYAERFSFPLPRLTEGEVCALFLMDKLLGQLEGTPYAKALASAGVKLRALLTDEVLLPLGRETQMVSVSSAPLRGDEIVLAERFAKLQKASVEGHSMEINYFSATRNAESKRRVDPYHLHYHQGAWYLIAYCHSRDDIRIFALDRIRDLTVTDCRFERPANFNPDDYLGDSWGIERGEMFQLELVFDSHQARWIRERQWHAGQILKELPDGRLYFSAPAEGVEEIKQWILGFGSHVEVIGPGWLREEIVREVGRMRKLYETKD
jgi:predicted DNA-binding transcriptional regulator YafY